MLAYTHLLEILAIYTFQTFGDVPSPGSMPMYGAVPGLFFGSVKKGGFQSLQRAAI